MKIDTNNALSNQIPEREFVKSHLEQPDPASSLFIQRTWTVNDDLSENHVISGVQVIFDKTEDTQGLYAIYNVDRSKTIDTTPDVKGQIKHLTICADQLVVRGELSLPEIDVSLFVRELIFEDKKSQPGRINTSPLLYTVPKAADFNPVTNSAAQSGIAGRSAGNLEIYISHLRIPQEAGSVKRFIMNGGNGQDAGKGQPGNNGTNMSSCTKYTWNVKGTCGTSHFDLTFDIPAVYIDREVRWGASRVGGGTWGAPLFPTDGTNAEPPGRPGNAGDGGSLCSNLDLSIYIENNGGTAGNSAPAVKGGLAGKPIKSAHWKSKAWDNLFHYPRGLTYSKTATKETKGGQSFPSLKAEKTKGKTPRTICTGVTNAWLHPHLIVATLGYTRNVYLAEAGDTVVDLLSEYRQALLLPPSKKVGNRDLFDPAQYQSAGTEVVTLLQRMECGLDYFGHPAGWTPLLSLPASLKLYDKEVIGALRTLVLVRWISDVSKEQEQAAKAITHAIRELNQDTLKAVVSLEAGEKMLKGLVGTIYSLEQDLANLKIELETLRAKLLAEAKTKESVKAMINMATKTFSAICSVIPYGQPALSSVGSLATVVANYDSEDPCETVGGLADVFSGLAKAKLDSTAASIVKEVKDKGKEKKGDSEADKAKAKADRLTHVGKNLGPALSQVTEAVKGLRVPQSQIDAELARMEAQMPEFGELSGKIKALNARKTEFARQLDEASQTVGGAFSRITKNLTSIRVLEPQRKIKLGLLNHAAQLCVCDMGQRAQERLIEYLYYLAKSYESTLLEPCSDINYQLTAIFDKISNLLVGEGAKENLTVATLTKFAEDLKPLFDDNRKQIEHKLLKGYRREFTMNISTRLSVDQTPEIIKALNEQGEATLNLKDLGLVLADRERIRIGGVAISKLKLHEVSTDASGSAELTFEPLSDGTIRSADQLFAVRSWASSNGEGKTHGGSQQFWGATFSVSDPEHFTPITPSKETEELLKSLLGETTDEIKEKLIKPPAWTEIKVQFRRYVSNNPPDLSSIELDWTLNFTPLTNDNHFVLDVSVARSLAPSIRCDPPDVNSRTSGCGTLYRIYPRSTPVTLEVPTCYGQWQFSHWQLINTNTGKTEAGDYQSHQLVIRIDANMKAIAHFTPEKRVVHVMAATPVRQSRTGRTKAPAGIPPLSAVIFSTASLTNGIPVGQIVQDSTYTTLEGPTKKEGCVWWKIDCKGLVGWVTEG